MCGLAGIFHFDRSNLNPQLLNKFSEVLANRGPDDLGFLGWSQTGTVQLSHHPDQLSNCSVAMVHRRLSILDLSPTGWQPMTTLNGRYAIVFNGEIYNYLELQTELKALGYSFTSHSDTEVLLNAYAQWGIQSLHRLVGMFAFAILDTQKRSIFLARDFFGIKPLYYTHWQNGFGFASEIKALLEIPALNRQVNPQRLYDYLRFGITDCGEDTLFTNIHQIPAAHYLEVALDNPTEFQPVRYWQVDLDHRLDISFDEAARQLQEIFLNNISLHLRSDVPVGAALSGGIDSSSIVMAMRYLQPDLDLHTFSYTANDPRVNEEHWIDIIAQTSGSISHKIQATPEQLVADLDGLIYAQDQPFGSTSIYVQHRVFQLAHATGIKVMLDGQGADEMLGGYRYYLGGRLASLIRNGQYDRAIQFLQHASTLPDTNVFKLMLIGGGLLLPRSFQGSARKLVGAEFTPNWLNDTWFIERGAKLSYFLGGQSKEVLKDQLHHSLDNSLQGLLRYEDRNSMAFSIESRVPFLTPNLVNFLFSLPEEYIISPDCTSKAIFRQAMRGIVPDQILDRRDKIGFATPELSWLTSVRPWVEGVLTSEIAAQIPPLNIDIANKEWQEILAGRKKFDFQIWRWLNLIQWSEQYAIEFK